MKGLILSFPYNLSDFSKTLCYNSWRIRIKNRKKVWIFFLSWKKTVKISKGLMCCSRILKCSIFGTWFKISLDNVISMLGSMVKMSKRQKAILSGFNGLFERTTWRIQVLICLWIFVASSQNMSHKWWLRPKMCIETKWPIS